MVFQSTEISGLVGGQMAMFANQHAFSQQVGVMAGTTPQMPMGGMQNPFPSYALQTPMSSGQAGARIAGGMGMALPGIATGASLAGGLMGGTLGWLDPFTGMARGFASGAGAGGLGFGGTMGHLGAAMTRGGLAGFGGAMAGGMMGAAAVAAPYMLASQAIQTVGQNIYQGAQNIAEVGGLTQHFGTQFGQAGAMPGGGMGRQNIRGIVGALHELVGEDTMRSMESLKSLMDKAGQMGMLTGITDVNQFKQKFGNIVNQVQSIAKVMGTSLDEAAPMFAAMRQMGLWKASDVMGTAMVARAAGAAAPQMMQTMATGAQMAHAMGGTMRAGAMMGQQTFMTMQAAQRAGVLSEEQIAEFTGGLTGAEGQQAVAQRMTGIMGQFGQTSAGQLMMAGLGETREGRFTGSIDPEKLRRFQAGQYDVQDLQRMGMQATRGREGAMSFFRQRGRMGQELGAQGGIETMTQIVQQIADTRFGGSEEARHQLLQQMLGVGNEEAEMLGRLMNDLPRIRDEQGRQMDAAMRDTFRRLDERQNRSVAGLKDAISHAWGETVRPLQEFGERLATSMGEGMDDLLNRMTGRVRDIPMGAQERMRLLRSGAGTGAGGTGVTNLGQGWVTPGMLGTSIENIRAGGTGTLARAALGLTPVGLMAEEVQNIGRAFGAGWAGGTGAGIGMNALFESGQRAQALLDAGIRTGTGNVNLGGDTFTSQQDMVDAAQRAATRAQGGMMKKLQINESPQKRDAAAKIGAELRKMIGDPDTSKELRELKEKNPRGYAMELVRRLKASPAGQSFNLFGRSDMDALDVLAAVQEREGFGGGAHAADFGVIAKDLGMVQFASMDELKTAQDQALNQMVEASQTGLGAVAETITTAQLATTGAAVGAIAGPLGIAAGAWIGTKVGEVLRSGGLSKGDFETVMTGDNAELMQKFIRGEIDQATMATEVERREGQKGGTQLRKVFDEFRRNPERLKDAATAWERTRGGEAQLEFRRQMQESARGAVGAAELGLKGTTAERYTKLVEQWKGLREGEVAPAGLEELAAGLTGAERRMLAKGGGAVGVQAAVLSMVGGEKVGVMKEAETKEFLKRIRGETGVDIEAVGGARLQELLKGGVEAGEVKEVRDIMQSVSKYLAPKGGGGPADLQKQMLDLMTNYTSKNTEFVNSVNRTLAIEAGGDLSEQLKILEEKGKQLQTGSEGKPT